MKINKFNEMKDISEHEMTLTEYITKVRKNIDAYIHIKSQDVDECCVTIEDSTIEKDYNDGLSVEESTQLFIDDFELE